MLIVFLLISHILCDDNDYKTIFNETLDLRTRYPECVSLNKPLNQGLIVYFWCMFIMK